VLRLGFRNFPMDRFGVRKPELRKIARTPEIPPLAPASAAGRQPPDRTASAPRPAVWQQASVQALEGEAYSAFGVSKDAGGVHLVSVPEGSAAARGGLRTGDLVLTLDDRPVRSVVDLVRLTDAAAGRPIEAGIVRQQQPQTIRLADYVLVATEVSPDGAFKTLPLAPAERVIPIRAVATRPATNNEPPPTLYDGKLAAHYGPVFGNGGFTGLYRLDLGSVRTVASVSTWTYNQNGNRGTQRFTLYGSGAATDPGWDLQNFTPIADVDTAGIAAGTYQATRIRFSTGGPLGAFRWLVWAAHPLNATGEHSAYQEFQVLEATDSR